MPPGHKREQAPPKQQLSLPLSLAGPARPRRRCVARSAVLQPPRPSAPPPRRHRGPAPAPPRWRGLAPPPPLRTGPASPRHRCVARSAVSQPPRPSAPEPRRHRGPASGPPRPGSPSPSPPRRARRRPARAAPTGGPAPPTIAAGARAKRSRVAHRRLLRLISGAIPSPSCHVIPRGGPASPGPGSRTAVPPSARRLEGGGERRTRKRRPRRARRQAHR
ncbi:serine/arginine repetitive matrix protein 1-like [Panicum virgatum]|uniref:serine/arginine repetitive matrix protein 1-like n=1 Tax=Panicum virgatum TaxID=38727 RepID=UPI0019D65723|nr:serine/arginine repetitive matrix protein 1-like [Panicum virgatum]